MKYSSKPVLFGISIVLVLGLLAVGCSSGDDEPASVEESAPGIETKAPSISPEKPLLKPEVDTPPVSSEKPTVDGEEPSPELEVSVPSGPTKEPAPAATPAPMPRGTVDPDISVDIYDPDVVWAGATLMSDNHNQESPRIIEVNMLGEIIWEYRLPENLKRFTNPGFDVEWLPNNNVLLVLPGSGVYEVDRDGNIVWSHLDEKVSHDADRLPNGNTVFVFGNEDQKGDAQVKEVNPQGEIVWTWHAEDHFDESPYKDIYNQGWTHTNAVTRMANGNTLISLRNFGLMAEVDPQGEVVRTIGGGVILGDRPGILEQNKGKDPHSPHDPEILSNGNILVVSQFVPNRAVEIDLETYEVVWEFTISEQDNWPVRDANRLPNGNTLITGTTKIVEVTSEGEIVWQLSLKGVTFTGPESSARGFYKAERIDIQNIEETPQTSEESLYPSEETPSVPTPAIVSKALPEEIENAHFGFLGASYDSQGMIELGIKWDRPHPGPFIWGWVEVEDGEYYWQYVDQWVQQNQINGFGTLATIWPFASWDQANWELPAYTGWLVFADEIGRSRYKPYDMNAYRQFVSALVERYDGDGIDDMPGLEIPIKYWEAGNEPSMQSDFNAFFSGSSEDYLEILQVTYQAVKEADPEAKVLHAGMAGMDSWMASFWEPIFEKGSQYFDIANIHSIGGSDELNVPQFRELLSQYDIEKPIWVTEAQHRMGTDHSGRYVSPEEHGRIFAKSYILSFGSGVDKIFYTSFRAPPLSGESEFDQSALIDGNGEKRPAYHALNTLIQRLAGFSLAEKLTEGQYKFTVGDKIIYALWGTGSLPAEITGEVKVTDISGNEMLVDSATLTLTDDPIFVEATIFVSPPQSSNGDVVRLFYYGPSEFGGDPAALPGPHSIYSATSSDGMNFTEDTGVRFLYDTGQSFGITDADVVQLDDGSWLMFSSLGTSLIKATSSTSSGTFIRDTSFNWDRGGVPGSYDFDGVVRTFVCFDGGINMATYDQGSGDLVYDGVALNPPSDGVICDPSVIQVGENNYLMIYKYATSHAASPQEHEIYIATSSDGVTWSQHDQNRFICMGSVPGAVYFQGVIYIYYCGVLGPGELGLAVSEDGGETFNVLPKITIQGKTAAGIVDPAAVVVSE